MKRMLFNLIPAFLTLIFFVSGRPSLAQTSSISILSVNNLPDTVYQNQTYGNISVTVKNIGNNALTDTLFIFISQNDTFPPAVIDTFIFSPNFSILAGDSSTLSTFQYTFDTLAFKPGGNTVVIWPSCKSANTLDSAFTTFFLVTGPVGIAETPYPDHGFQLFPNPAQKQFRIYSKISPEQVRIYDSGCRLVYDKPYNGKEITIDALKPGSYLVQCRYKNNKILVRKLLKL